MHTLTVIAGGFVLLGLLLLLGHRFGGGAHGIVSAAKWFLPLWFVAAAVNLIVGVVHAGYTVRAEAPIFLAVFGVPAGAALLIWWKSK